MSEGVARSQWGSQWRWRLLLLLVSFVLLVYGWILADLWHMRWVVAGSSSPGLLRIERRGGLHVEAFDWKTGKTWYVANLGPQPYWNEVGKSLRGVGDGKVVAWHEAFTLHVVDVAPPHEHRQYVTPAKNETDWASELNDSFVGMTGDERYAVFQSRGRLRPKAGGGTQVLPGATMMRSMLPLGWSLRVVDLRTGEIVDTRTWESTMTLNGASGAFLSHCGGLKPSDPSEPAAALWRISSEGKLEQIEDRDARFVLGTSHVLAKNAQGRWRLLRDEETAQDNEVRSTGSVMAASPTGSHVLLYDARTPSLVLLDTSSLEVRVLANSPWSMGLGEFVDNGRKICIADMRDDLRLFDVETGQLISMEKSGSQRRDRMLVVATLLLLASLFFLTIAFREQSLAWALTDVLASGVLIEAACGYAILGILRPLLTNLPGFVWVAPSIYFSHGMFVGTATLVGIYWGFGQRWLPCRWMIGGLSLLLFAIPISIAATLYDNQWSPGMVLAIVLAYGLIFAGAGQAVGLFVCAMGWTLRDVPVEDNPRQYRLASFFLIVASIGVLTVVSKWLFSNPPNQSFLYYAMLGFAMVAVGMMLAGILLFGTKAWLIVGATASLWFVVSVGIYVHVEYFGGAMSRQEAYFLDSSMAVGVALNVAVPCLVLRSRGWRWRRGHVATKISEVAAPAV